MTLLESVKQLLEECKLTLNYAENTKTLPECKLITKMEKGKKRYYSYNPETKTTKYLKDDNLEAIRALEEKDYRLKLQKTLANEMENLERVQSILEKTPDWHKVFYGIPEEKRHLIKPYEVRPVKVSEEDVERWKRRNRGRRNQVTNNKTMNGEYVKSKSELIIADRLKAAGVPYVYEVNLGLAEEHTGTFVNWNPDFKVLNVRTGKEYYWEHLGKMDNQEYFAIWMMKLETYWKNDIVLGDNLIITMETSTAPVSTEYVDCLINRLLK